VNALKEKITRDFTKAIPTMAKLLIAQEGIKNAKKHDIVSDFLKHNRDEDISFLNESDPNFKKIYCEVNGIDNIPSHSIPPLFDLPAMAPTPTQGVPNLRGGAGLEMIDPDPREATAASAAAHQAPTGNLGFQFTRHIAFKYSFNQHQEYAASFNDEEVNAPPAPVTGAGAPPVPAVGANQGQDNIVNNNGTANNQTMGGPMITMGDGLGHPQEHHHHKH